MKDRLIIVHNNETESWDVNLEMEVQKLSGAKILGLVEALAQVQVTLFNRLREGMDSVKIVKPNEKRNN